MSCEGVQTKFLFIGGHHSPSFIPGHIKNRHNFEGCLQQVYFKVSETIHGKIQTLKKSDYRRKTVFALTEMKGNLKAVLKLQQIVYRQYFTRKRLGHVF